MTTSFKIGNRFIGSEEPVFIIAEMSANHNQDLDRAVEIIRSAKLAGADAVKIQTYTADTMTLDLNSDLFRINGTRWHGKTLHELYRDAYTPWEWHERLFETAKEEGLILFSSPFDTTSVDFLEDLGAPAYKIASFEIVDIPLLKKVGSTRKPVIVSTGMATQLEIKEALETLKSVGAQEIALLKCTSAYPAQSQDMNLSTIVDLRSRFGLTVGLSDHSMDLVAPLTATALGGSIIEKHFTLSRKENGPDSSFSLEPSEFSNMVAAVRAARKAFGSVHYGPSFSERDSVLFRRSLFVSEFMLQGDIFDSSNVRAIRPSNGIHTRYLDDVIGKKAATRIERGTPLSWDLVD